MTILSQTETPNEFAQVVTLGAHTLRADVSEANGGKDLGPSPHDLFDASLAACKTTTAHWYAKRANMPLERVECSVERDDSKEREGVYKLTVKLAYFGPLTPEQRTKLHSAVMRCPLHKLMTTTEVVIETAPL
ncbi:MAG: OsmC family protein [Polyangiales bacterium]